MIPRFASLLLAGAALAVGASFSAPARADDAPREAPSTIVVLCTPGDRFGLRVQAELEALGFRAVLLDPAAEPASRLSLEVSAREAGAIAAIRAVPSERGVEVWIADRVTGKTVLREVRSEGAATDRDATLALRTVDLLRASLLELALPAPPPGEIPAPPELLEKMKLPEPGALAEKPAPTLRLSLSPGVLLSPGGFHAAASLDVGLAWMPNDHVGACAFAAVPLTRPSVAGAQGSADLAVLLAGGGMRFLFTTRENRWAPSADLGVMAVSFKTIGTTGVGSAAGTASALTAAPFSRFGVAFAPTPMLRLRADTLVSVTTQRVSVALAAQEIATWGRPLVLSSVGVDFGWF